MANQKKVLMVIPARGGSKGIPRKNLRPLNGKPLISYSINAGLGAKSIYRVAVSTEDKEISLFAERFGADVIPRPLSLSGDAIPIDPVVIHAVNYCEQHYNEHYTSVVTVQPTSPLLLSSDIDSAVERLAHDSVETVISVCNDKHLRWRQHDGVILPEYEKRVNRQFLPDVYRETGAIIACQRNVLKSDSRIGKKIGLHIIDDDRSIDVDNHRDLWLCELILKKKRVAIVVIGNSTVGMGHVYRTLMLAHELIRHEVIFICRDSDTLAIEYISKHNYKMVIARHGDFLREIRSLQPDMVINDILDTSADYIRQLKEMVPYVVNFEDMGIGAEAADLVINALYPHHFPQNHILVGQKYYCLRDEFFHIKSKEKCNSVGNILVTFGGVDEGNITCRIIDLLASIASSNKIEINVVLGPGYVHQADLKHLLQRHESFRVNIINATNRISDYMNSADLAITSGGRTVYELLSLAVPTLVISQNLRETTHAFASSQNGVVNLGLHTEVADETIRDMIKRLLTDSRLRKTMVKKMNKLDLRAGKKRVLDRINTLLG